MFVGVMVFGLFSLMNLAVDQYPEIEIPQISVITFYPGANAADIETNITRVLEDNLNTVSNLKKLTSKSQDNVSMITVEFEYGSDLTEGANEIRDVVSRSAVAAARRHRLSDDLQVLDLDDPRDHACRHGRRELPGAEQDPRRQARQRPQPRRRRGCRDGHGRPRTRGAGQCRPGQARSLQSDRRAAGADHRRRERQHPERYDRHRQQHLQHQGRRRVQADATRCARSWFPMPGDAR